MKIYKNKRNKGNFFHKVPRGINCTKTKRQALIDISKECERNYVSIESIVLKSCSYTLTILNINTNLL